MKPVMPSTRRSEPACGAKPAKAPRRTAPRPAFRDDVLRVRRWLKTLERDRLAGTGQGSELEDWLRDCVEPFLGMAALKQVDLSWELDSTLPGALRFDANRVRLGLCCLIDEAFARCSRGRIEVLVERVGAGPAQPWFLRFEVTATGPGCDRDVEPGLFDGPGAAGGGVGSVGGGGFSLSLCRHLVAWMQGRLGVITVPGQGTRFWFELAPSPPAWAQAQPARPR
ncbi:MAG: HAMP domain-containing histidine kinase [Burkholderiales bacterium]|nr:HAMP domain-containing histidine kinase [Burkholderiales bacterium]